MNEYDIALQNIFDTGWELKKERTGFNCRVKLGITTRYDISNRVPLMTYRQVFWKSFVKEVLWYITGSDKISDLQKMDSHIWDPWIDSNFSKINNFEESSIGYGYGPNLIHFGGVISKNNLPSGGFNQLDYVINTLRINPSSRQAMFILWRPDKLAEVKLPACHCCYHFTVSPNSNGEMKVLNCEIFQRSADYPIGVNANLFMGSIFTYLIAQQLDMVPGELIHAASHCHIYNNALAATNEYLDRVNQLDPIPSPKLVINKRETIYDYTIDDFTLVDYNPLPKIHFPIAI